MKKIEIKWCKNFIQSVFENGGIEVNLFWNKAEESGLWVRGTYGTPMSQALEEITRVETISGENGNFLYNVFRLK